MKTGLLILAKIFAVCICAAHGQENAPAITSHIPRQKIDSSVITEIGYSKRRHWLELQFANGDIYRYVDVPPSVYRDLMAAESKAGYYADYIRSNYESIRVRPRAKSEGAR